MRSLNTFSVWSAITCVSLFTAGTVHAATFVPIAIPDAAYQSSTTLIPITPPPCTNLGTPADPCPAASIVTALSSGPFALTFSSPDPGNIVLSRDVVPVGWATWNVPPAVETATPRVVQDEVALACNPCTLTINFSHPVKIFGFEAEPDPRALAHTITASFFNGATLVGTIPFVFPNGNGTARLFAASTDGQFTSVVITIDGTDFALAQFRAALALGNDTYQVSYASNLQSGDSYVNVTNSGVRNGFDPAGGICVNAYVFDPSEELVDCCSCYVTPDGLKSFSVKQDLISNTLTPGVPGSVVIKLLASVPVAGNTCNAASVNQLNLEGGMRAWRTTLHQNSVSGNFEQTDNEFSGSALSDSELTKLSTYCGFIQSNGSGFGICKSCRVGGLGGAQK